MQNDKSKKPTHAPMTYAGAGVDINAGNALVERIKPLVRATKRPGSDTEIGGFGGLFDLKAAGYKDPILVGANDGVGTKLKVALEANYHSTVGVDLVAMCVNDIIVQGAEPLFFLDYFATGQLLVEQATTVISGIAEGCKRARCALIGGETAEMPGMYQKNDYDLAGFAVGAVERGGLLPRGDIGIGDVILGLSSSGAHSNGFSLIRKIVEKANIGWQEPAPFSPEQTLGEALLTPTKIYVAPVLAAIRQNGGIKALAHITGGGFIENIPRVLPKNVTANIDLSAIRVPTVFQWLAQQGAIPIVEMLRTFNCGIGLIIIVESNKAGDLEAILTAEGEEVSYIGEIVAHQNDRVNFHGTLDL